MKRKLKLYFLEITVDDVIGGVELKEHTEQVLTEEQYDQIKKTLSNETAK